MALLVHDNPLLGPIPHDPDLPFIGWHSVLTPAGIAADFELEEDPASDLANPDTSLVWRSGSTEPQTITFDLPPVMVDYLGIARHNLGSGGTGLSVEALGTDTDEWMPLLHQRLFGSDGPIILRWPPLLLSQLRIVLEPDVVAPEIAVCFVGRGLVMPLGIFSDQTLPFYARRTEVAVGVSERGQFRGRIETGRGRSTSLGWQYLDADWYRREMDPFVELGQGTPFFFSGFPRTRAREAAFCWLTNDPQPVESAPDWVAINLAMDALLT